MAYYYDEDSKTSTSSSFVIVDGFQSIPDRFETLEEVIQAIKKAGMESWEFIIATQSCYHGRKRAQLCSETLWEPHPSIVPGIDYTMSNCSQGQTTFGGKSLHDMDNHNPYQEMLCILGDTMGYFDTDGIIPVFGFGDKRTTDQSVFPLKQPDGFCEGFDDALLTYKNFTKKVTLGGPSHFAPVIRKAVEIYHILVILTDGQVTSEKDTIGAIVDASEYPLSIVVVGIGDGPWEVMTEFDDKLPKRKFDNFQFVDFHKIKKSSRNPQADVALAVLMEIPQQYELIKEHNLLGKLLLPTTII